MLFPLADTGPFSYAGRVNSFPAHPAVCASTLRGGLREFTFSRILLTALLAVCAAVVDLHADDAVAAEQREAFTAAWKAARNGKRADFEAAMPGLRDYLLYPYLQYEDLRFRRSSVSDGEMSDFLETHRDWAFASGLERAWLRALGKRKQWDSVLQYGGDSEDTEVRCHFATARIERGMTDGLEAVARSLWTAGKSQPDACDPVFAWLKRQDGISSGLAWERIRLAMAARERNLARYVARYLDPADLAWSDRWQQQDRGGYRRLQQAGKWPDEEKAWQISEFGLGRLARNDPDRAWEIFRVLDGRFSWPEVSRGGILAELALWSAVGGSEGTMERMDAVPAAYREDRLMEWRARYAMTQGDWAAVADSIAAMQPQLKDDSRWRYWEARAFLESGRADEANEGLHALAGEANYYGFLAADYLDLPYSICPEEPDVAEERVRATYETAGFKRALELREVGLSNWARSEWKLAERGFDRDGLRASAAVATREGWPDIAIFALGNSGDLRWYEWRFPLGYAELARSNAEANALDPSWVMGLMRSESALAEDAISHAGARGLMQVTPHTATQLSRRHSLAYSGRTQLLDAQTNVRFGTTYLGELMERFGDNPVLVSAAYNAGPHAVDRWIADGYTGDPTVWIDTLPYFETRDYIPRVLAFSTLYEWRFGQPVKRVSSRMLPVGRDSEAEPVAPGSTAEVVCRAPGD